MLVTFICPEWRDTAYSRTDGEGEGSYRRDRILELEVEDINSLIEDEYFDWDNRRTLFFDKELVSIEECKVYGCIVTFNSEKD